MKMFEWFKQNDIGRKLQAAVDDVINGDSWGPFEGLEKGEALVRVTLAKGEVIRFEKAPKNLRYDDINKLQRTNALPLVSITGIIEYSGPGAPELPETETESPDKPVKPRRKRT